jgi:hypothetical protein
MTQTTEYWLKPIDEYDDSIDIIFCDSEKDARLQREGLGDDYPDAQRWMLEKVVRRYASDGDLKDEHITELKRNWL